MTDDTARDDELNPWEQQEREAEREADQELQRTLKGMRDEAVALARAAIDQKFRVAEEQIMAVVKSMFDTFRASIEAELARHLDSQE